MGGFVGCSGLTIIAIPATVESIGAGAFSGCSALTSFDVDSSNPSFSSLDGVLLNKGQTNLIAYPVAKSGAYRVPDGVTAIQDELFRGLPCSDRRHHSRQRHDHRVSGFC
jgi:hypothetical protein